MRDVFNYNKQLVCDLLASSDYDDLSSEDKDDIACIALNHLPAKYISNQIDMSFYLNYDKKEQMGKIAEIAITEAIAYLASSEDEPAK